MSYAGPSSHRTGWSGRSTAEPAVIAALQDQLSVALIATPRHVLQTCRSDEDVAVVAARNHERFDYFPVTDAARTDSERIIGLIELAPYVDGACAEGIVRDHMHRLSEDNVIGADAGILTFVRSADRQGCRLVISGAVVSGLVTLSDLQRLPVRAALFAMITQLEMTMAEAIRRECGDTNEWLGRLSACRQNKVNGERQKARSANSVVDDILFTQFSDKTTIIRKSRRFTYGKTKFEDEMSRARQLRDDLAHANEYAASRPAAAQVCATVRNVEAWIERLTSWPPGEDHVTDVRQRCQR